MKKNSYETKDEKESLLGAITTDLATKGDVKNTAIETIKDVVIGVVAGGVAGSAIGRASLIVGAAVTGLGHYYKSRLASVFGVGMMAANGFQQTAEQMKGTPKEGLEGMIEGAKERVLNFKDSFKQKLFLDKILKDEKKSDTKGVGEVQYFTYPENKELGEGDREHFRMLERLQEQVEDEGKQFIRRKEISGDVQGNQMGELDPEQNY